LRGTDPRFALTEHKHRAVVDICRHLDGIALAIEWRGTPRCSRRGLRARLDDVQRFEGRPRLHEAPPDAARLTGLEPGLLMQDEQTVFRRLGVFRRQLQPGKRAAVTADDRIDSGACSTTWGAGDKSLVVAEMGSTTYRLLESATFAMEKVQQADETMPLRRSHAEDRAGRLRRLAREEYVLPTGTTGTLLPELDNAVAALDWQLREWRRADCRSR